MNSDIHRVLSAEWLKLGKRRTTLVMPAIVVALAVFTFIAVAYATRRDWIGVPSGFYLASSTVGWLVNILGLLGIIITCFHISGEFSLGTVKPAWVRPISRHGWYSAKLISACAAAGFLMILAVLVVVLLSGFRFGFSALMEKDYMIHSAGSQGMRFVLVVGLTLWALWAVITAVGMIAAFFNRPGSAIAVSIGLAFVMTLLAVFRSARPFLLSACLTLPFEQMTAMTKGLPLPLTWGTLIWRTVLCAGIWMTVTCAAGQFIVKRKEITF